MKIHCLQHVLFEDPGTILEWAAQNHHSISYTYLFEPQVNWPDINTIDGLVIMGGPMNVDEEEKYPWLSHEKLLIKETIKRGKKVLGICLGAQLIAAVLGGRVYTGSKKEIGFFPVNFTVAAMELNCLNHFTNPSTVFHWHGDSFTLAENAVLLASSAIYQQQAFSIGNNVLGLQFHLEMTEAIITKMIQFNGEELDASSHFIQSPEKIREGFTYLQQNKKDIFLLLNKFFECEI